MCAIEPLIDHLTRKKLEKVSLASLFDPRAQFSHSLAPLTDTDNRTQFEQTPMIASAAQLIWA